MPNWITNCVTIEGSKEDCKKVRDSVSKEEKINSLDLAALAKGGEPQDHTTSRVEENDFNFDAIVPMPEELKDTEKNYQNESNQKLIDKYGSDNWYDWSCQNWGTKWNTNSPEWETENYIEFDTAWATPEPIWRALAEQHPNVMFTIQYADEDIGSNCGELTLHVAKDIDDCYEYTDYPMNYHRKKKILIKCKPYLEEDYDFDNDEWKIDED
tara:strand:- start:2164 stop:2799 length:636 start_codon:yes stop_codon:yes gene_type:complete